MRDWTPNHMVTTHLHDQATVRLVMSDERPATRPPVRWPPVLWPADFARAADQAWAQAQRTSATMAEGLRAALTTNRVR